MPRPEIPRSQLSVGMEWASRVTGVGMGFALPPLLGALADRWMDAGHVGVLIGAALGMAVGAVGVLQLARDSAPKPPGPTPDRGGGGGGGSH